MLREPIAESWRRAEIAGLEPTSALGHITHADIDRGSALLSAAAPVLEDLNARLEGTKFATVLVDRDARVAHLGCADHGTRRAIDGLGIGVGASLLEESVGTNAPGTVLETRSGLSVHGSEHFATALKRFSCYGHPIFHPSTRRIEGVLDLTAMVDEASPLLPPLVARAVADIEQRLLEGSRISDTHLLAAFQAASVRRRPVVAIGHDMVMSNRAALDLLGSNDVNLLRMLAPDAREGMGVEMTLESGTRATVTATRVGGARGGSLLHVQPHHDRRPAAAVRPPTHAPMLVTGPPGSGRTTRARELAGVRPVTMLTAAAALMDGPGAWAHDLAAVVRSGQGVVCVDGVDLLDDGLVELVAAHAGTSRAPQVILVSCPPESLEGRAAALAGQSLERHALPPLASRLHELPELVSAMLRSMDSHPSLHLTPGALAALAAQAWPGNLRELKAVLEHVVRRRSTGGVAVDDLPEDYRASVAARPMAGIERAARDAIIAALHECDGNKRQAAAALGISRSTLYSKMRSYRIT